MAWELHNVEAIECKMDDSHMYTAINYVGSEQIRVDIMTDKDEPVKSFIGFFSDVRKYVIRFMSYNVGFSLEHASYIGEQIALANEQKEAYIQD
jgi:hypothetical protein